LPTFDPALASGALPPSASGAAAALCPAGAGLGFAADGSSPPNRPPNILIFKFKNNLIIKSLFLTKL
jgi:hypothetical protein